MIIILSKEEVRVCTLLAVERWLTKFDSIDRPNYAKGKKLGRLEPEINANIRANVAEWAVARAYNLQWSVPWYPNKYHLYRKDIPDVGNLEVRTVRTQTSIPFWKKDIDKTIVGTKVLDEEYYSKVKIYGMFKASEYMIDTYYQFDIQGWRVPIEVLERGTLG